MVLFSLIMENNITGEQEPSRRAPVHFVAHEFILPGLKPEEYNELFSVELAIVENLLEDKGMDGALSYVYRDMLGEVNGERAGKLRHGYEVAADILHDNTRQQFEEALKDRRFSTQPGVDLSEAFRIASEKIAELAELVSMIAASSRGLGGPYKHEIATLIFRSERLDVTEQLRLIEEAARHLDWQ